MCGEGGRCLIGLHAEGAHAGFVLTDGLEGLHQIVAGSPHTAGQAFESPQGLFGLQARVFELGRAGGAA